MNLRNGPETVKNVKIGQKNQFFTKSTKLPENQTKNTPEPEQLQNITFRSAAKVLGLGDDGRGLWLLSLDKIDIP